MELKKQTKKELAKGIIQLGNICAAATVFNGLKNDIELILAAVGGVFSFFCYIVAAIVFNNCEEE